MTLRYVGWMVLHSLWQGAFIGGVAALLLGLLPDARARVRHVIACAALALMVALPCATALVDHAPLGGLAGARAVYALDAAVPIDAVFAAGPGLLTALGVAWPIGVAFGAVRFARDWRSARALRTGARPAGRRVSDTVRDLCVKMGIAQPVPVCCSSRVSAPMLSGSRRPVILLPPGLEATLTTPQLRAVLAHELAHHRRADYPINLMQVAADTLLFHHPAAWWISRRARAEREYCCDDAAVAIGGDMRAYAHALAALEDARGARIAVAASCGTLLDRIQRMAGIRRPTLSPARGAAFCVLASLSATVLLLVAIAVPPPWLPPGTRLRRPGPPAMSVPDPGPSPARAPMLPRSRSPQR